MTKTPKNKSQYEDPRVSSWLSMPQSPRGFSIGDDSSYNPYIEYERRKRELPPLEPKDYAAEIEKICKELGI